jgi:starch synthase
MQVNDSRTIMHIVMATSEAIPFAKTGGLADVVGTLPMELVKLGHQCSVFLPAYACVKEVLQAGRLENRHWNLSEGVAEVTIDHAGMACTAKIHRVRLDPHGVDFYLVDQPMFFDREGLYGDSSGTFGDNSGRFCFFSRVVVEAIEKLGLAIDIIHCHDWQTGLIPAYHRTRTQNWNWYHHAASVMTIHNMAYQGRFWGPDMALTGLDGRYFNWQQMEFFGDLNLLKTGLVFSDMLTTVSPTYAKEIQTPASGCGLDGVLRARADRLIGIVNGVDYGVWDPSVDEHLTMKYTVENWREGKGVCKRQLQESLGLPMRPEVPMIGIISRFAEQKGWDLIIQLMHWWIDHQDVQWVILGSGEERYSTPLSQLRARRPDRIAMQSRFSDSLAHRIEAAADLFLMPSQYEPCGLNQLYSLRYGTLPVVRATGGLADTIVDATVDRISERTATGFSFVEYSPEALADSTLRALTIFRESTDKWGGIVETGMRQDWSWKRSAEAMLGVYRRAREFAAMEGRL